MDASTNERASAGSPVKIWSMKDLKPSGVCLFEEDMFGDVCLEVALGELCLVLEVRG